MLISPESGVLKTSGKGCSLSEHIIKNKMPADHESNLSWASYEASYSGDANIGVNYN